MLLIFQYVQYDIGTLHYELRGSGTCTDNWNRSCLDLVISSHLSDNASASTESQPQTGCIRRVSGKWRGLGSIVRYNILIYISAVRDVLKTLSPIDENQKYLNP